MLIYKHLAMRIKETSQTPGSGWRTPVLHRFAALQEREEQVFLVLALVIGALTGAAVVAFIALTKRLGPRRARTGRQSYVSNCARMIFAIIAAGYTAA